MDEGGGVHVRVRHGGVPRFLFPPPLDRVIVYEYEDEDSYDMQLHALVVALKHL